MIENGSRITFGIGTESTISESNGVDVELGFTEKIGGTAHRSVDLNFSRSIAQDIDNTFTVDGQSAVFTGQDGIRSILDIEPFKCLSISVHICGDQTTVGVGIDAVDLESLGIT